MTTYTDRPFDILTPSDLINQIISTRFELSRYTNDPSRRAGVSVLEDRLGALGDELNLRFSQLEVSTKAAELEILNKELRAVRIKLGVEE